MHEHVDACMHVVAAIVQKRHLHLLLKQGETNHSLFIIQRGVFLAIFTDRTVLYGVLHCDTVKLIKNKFVYYSRKSLKNFPVACTLPG